MGCGSGDGNGELLTVLAFDFKKTALDALFGNFGGEIAL
jgi:hypothetical protein